MSQVTGLNVNKSSFHHIKKKQERGDECGKKTTRSQELLMSNLKKWCSDGKARCTALCHDITDTSMLAVTKCELKRKQEEPRRQREKETGEPITELQDSETTLGDTPDFSVTMELDSKELGCEVNLKSGKDKLGLREAPHSIRDQLVVGKRVLVGTAWCHEESRLMFEKFSEVVMVDVTKGSNNQGRKLLTTSILGPNMEAFSPLQVFLPSECQWVFNWFCGDISPKLMGKEACRRIQLMLTDGDSNMHHAFEDNKEEHCPNTQHGLCICHLVSKPLEDMGSCLHCMDDSVCQWHKLCCKNWLFDWMRLGGVEDEDEFELSHILPLQWLASKFREEQPESTSKETRKACKHNLHAHETLLKTKVMDYKKRWFFPNRKDILHLQQKSTSALQSVHQTFKCGASKTELI